MILTNGATGYGGCRQTIKQREGKHSKGRDYLQRERQILQRERILQWDGNRAKERGSFSAAIASFLAAVKRRFVEAPYIYTEAFFFFLISGYC